MKRIARGEKLSKLGEVEILRRIKALAGNTPPGVPVGIGDDAAVTAPKKGCLQVSTTDSLLEGVHFDLRTFPWSDLGFRAVMVNASDIVAMGAVPEFFLVSLALPGETRWSQVEDFYAGVAEGLKDCGASLVGGDLDSFDRVAIQGTMLGSVRRRSLIRLDGGRPGDTVYVTGTLGDSLLGLELLRSGGRLGGKLRAEKGVLIERHRRPVYLGHLLTGLRRRFRPTAMTDLSDGLARDLEKIALACGVGSRVELESLPISPECFLVSESMGVDPRLTAARGGEDFQLLFTSEVGADRAVQEVMDVPVTPVGRLESKRGLRWYLCGRKIDVGRGYEHFRPSSTPPKP